MSSPGPKSKRENVLDWQDYFMGTAFLAGKRSKDPNCQVGACIVNKDKVIVGVGYNGMPRGCSDDVFPWDKWGETPLDTKKLYVCHAEMNAIMNKNMSDIKDCSLYVTRFPCNECAKMIIQAGIKEVYYLNMEGQEVKVHASERMFQYAGVHYEQYQPKCNKIEIDFTSRQSGVLSLTTLNLDSPKN